MSERNLTVFSAEASDLYHPEADFLVRLNMGDQREVIYYDVPNIFALETWQRTSLQEHASDRGSTIKQLGAYPSLSAMRAEFLDQAKSFSDNIAAVDDDRKLERLSVAASFIGQIDVDHLSEIATTAVEVATGYMLAQDFELSPEIANDARKQVIEAVQNGDFEGYYLSRLDYDANAVIWELETQQGGIAEMARFVEWFYLCEQPPFTFTRVKDPEDVVHEPRQKVDRASIKHCLTKMMIGHVHFGTLQYIDDELLEAACEIIETKLY